MRNPTLDSVRPKSVPASYVAYAAGVDATVGMPLQTEFYHQEEGATEYTESM